MLTDEAEGRLGERLARVEVALGDLIRDIQKIDRALEGPPREESIRGRLHRLENGEAAAKAAAAAVEAAKHVRHSKFSRWQKTVLFGVAILVAIDPFLKLIDRF